MTIDTKELRRLAQAATPGPDGVSLSLVTLLQDFQKGANPAAIVELLDRLEAAEEDRSNFIVEMGKLCAQCDALRAENAGLVDDMNLLRDNNTALRARIERMEKQEPVTLDHLACVDNGVLRFMTGRKAPAHDCELYAMPNGKAAPMLYALPGAQPAPSVPEGFALVNATHFLAVLDREDWRTAKNRAELRAMLAAQPAPIINEGWKLVPIEPTKEMRDAWDSAPICEDDDAEFRRAYSEMLAAAPEAKP